MLALSLSLGAALADEVRVTVDLADLLADRTPAVVGAGALQPCLGDSASQQDLQGHLERAESALPLLDLEAATTALALAAGALGCLDEAVAGSTAARVAYLQGLVAVLDQQPEAAQAAFEAALTLRPGLPWDDAWAPDLRPPYDAAKAALQARAPAQVTLFGTPGAGNLWLDGRPWELRPGVHAISGGQHYLQLAGSPWQTWTLTLEPGADTLLVLPGALGEEASAWAADPAQQHRLEPLLGLVVAPGSELVVHAEAQTFEVAPGDGGWGAVREPRHPGRWVAMAGGALAAGAGVLATLSYVEARGAVSGAEEAPTWSDYLAAQLTYDSAADRYRGALVAEGLGIAVLGVGLAVEWRFGRGSP